MTVYNIVFVYLEPLMSSAMKNMYYHYLDVCWDATKNGKLIAKL